MSPSIFRRIVCVVLLALVLPYHAFAQEGASDYVEEEETVEADKSAQKAEKAPEPPRNAYVLELVNVRDNASAALVRKQLENLLERGASVIKTRSTWGRLTYEIRTSMAASEIKNGLTQMQLEETKLKSVSLAGSRFTVEIQ